MGRAECVSEGEVEQEYTSQIDSFRIPARRQLAIIEVKRTGRESVARAAELKQRIETARAMALSGNDEFSAAAAKYSDDQASRYRGGDIGWLELGKNHAKVPPEVMEAGHELAAGEAVSEVIETVTGYYLVRCLASKPAAVSPLKQVAARLRSELLKDKRASAERAFEAKLEAAVVVTRFPGRLEKLAQPEPVSEPAPPRIR
ncbi:MAG: peptidyl-prolyl cis-trans isomerase C [Verrucomicrobiales bacterium]|jgi:peptidyl-prolyl cis-trans isomerase C